MIRKRGQHIPPEVIAAARHREVEVTDEKYPRRILAMNKGTNFTEKLRRRGWDVDEVNVEKEQDYRHAVAAEGSGA